MDYKIIVGSMEMILCLPPKRWVQFNKRGEDPPMGDLAQERHRRHRAGEMGEDKAGVSAEGGPPSLNSDAQVWGIMIQKVVLVGCN